eukprot:Opistho-2@76589
MSTKASSRNELCEKLARDRRLSLRIVQSVGTILGILYVVANVKTVQFQRSTNDLTFQIPAAESGVTVGAVVATDPNAVSHAAPQLKVSSMAANAEATSLLNATYIDECRARPAYCDGLLFAPTSDAHVDSSAVNVQPARAEQLRLPSLVPVALTTAPDRPQPAKILRCPHAPGDLCWRATWDYCKSSPTCLFDEFQTNASSSTFFGVGSASSSAGLSISEPSTLASVAMVSSGDVVHVGIQAQDDRGQRRTCGGDSFHIELRGPSIYVGHAIDNLNGTYSFYAVLYDVGVYEVRARLDYRACEGMTRCLGNRTTIAIEWVGEPVEDSHLGLQPAQGESTVQTLLLPKPVPATITVVDETTTCIPSQAADCLHQLRKSPAVRYRCDIPLPDDPRYRHGRWKKADIACADDASPSLRSTPRVATPALSPFGDARATRQGRDLPVLHRPTAAHATCRISAQMDYSGSRLMPIVLYCHLSACRTSGYISSGIRSRGTSLIRLFTSSVRT